MKEMRCRNDREKRQRGKIERKEQIEKTEIEIEKKEGVG